MREFLRMSFLRVLGQAKLLLHNLRVGLLARLVRLIGGCDAMEAPERHKREGRGGERVG